MSEAVAGSDGGSLSLLKLAGGLFAASIAIWIVLMVPVLSAARLNEGEQGTMLVAFWPGGEERRMFRSIVDAGGLPIRQVGLRSFWVVETSDPDFIREIGEKGAIGAYRDLPVGVVLAGCSGVIATPER